jgi:hypothetical protein
MPPTKDKRTSKAANKSKGARSPPKARGSSSEYTKTTWKDGAGRVIYTKKGSDYVRRRGPDGSIVHRRAAGPPGPKMIG